jgi:hypothetical protein
MIYDKPTTSVHTVSSTKTAEKMRYSRCAYAV